MKVGMGKTLRYLKWRITRNFGEQDYPNPNVTMGKYLAYQLQRLFGDFGYIPFVVITSARCGSNLLMSVLDNHPEVYVRGECMAFVNGGDAKQLLHQRVFCRQPRQVRAVGFKAFYYHPFDDHSGNLWSALQSIESLRIIFLYRQQKLEQYVSQQLAGKSGAWWNTGGRKEVSPGGRLSISADALLQFLERQEQFERVFTQRFATHTTLHLRYETFVSQRSSECERIAVFLGIEPFVPSSPLRKQNRAALPELIANYASLEDRFGSTKWSYLFGSGVQSG